MVGFIKGIFGPKQKADTDVTPAPEAPPKQPKQKPQAVRPQAFYLDSSDARTLGDIDYMQTAQEIKRSFPKTFGGEELRTVSVVSSLQRSASQKAQAIAAQQPQIKTTPASSTFAPQTTQVSGWTAPKADNPPKVKDPKERRRADSSLDTFRTMARDIQKSNGRTY